MALPPDSMAARSPTVTVAVLASGTALKRIAGVDGAALGLLTPGIGTVSGAQTYLDISQGNRLSEALYDDELPRIRFDLAGVRRSVWQEVVARADAAPAELVPGLLATTLEEAGLRVVARAGIGDAALIAADRQGRIVSARNADCPAATCPAVFVTRERIQWLRELAWGLGGDDLLIAIERPKEGSTTLAIAIAGSGYEGLLTSDSTRTPGFVTTTDIAPTILERLGVGVPDEMNGEAIESEGDLDVEALATTRDRLEVKGGRRVPVVGVNVLAWCVLAALAALALGRRGGRIALRLLMLSVVYLPMILLFTGLLYPSVLGERLMVGLAAPLLAAATLLLLPGWRALAVATALTCGAYAVDAVTGSTLIRLSILGPNLAAGGRFFGIVNEIEAVLGALVPIGVGAALASRPSTRQGGHAAAAAFLAAGLVAAVIFSIGRFGADVGAAMVLPSGAAAAAAVVIGSRRGALLALLAPAGGLIGLAVADILVGGGAHFTKSVIDANNLGEVWDVVDRHARLAIRSYGRMQNTVLLPVVAVVVLAGAVRWRSVLGWFAERSALAGFVGALVATVIATLANDSSAVLLIFGMAYVAATAGYAWSLRDQAR